MGWGIIFNQDIYLNRLRLDSKQDLIELIEDTNQFIADIEREIAMLVASTPKDIVLDVGENVLEYLDLQLKEKHQLLKENVLLLGRIEMLLEYLDDNPDVDIKTLNK
jgi:hypothetical protein